MMIFVTLDPDRFGHLTVRPPSRSLRQAITKYLRAQAPGVHPWLYLQNQDDVEYFLENYPPRSKRRDVRNGYRVTIKMPAWDYLSMLGYDAAEHILYNKSRRIWYVE